MRRRTMLTTTALALLLTLAATAALAQARRGAGTPRGAAPVAATPAQATPQATLQTATLDAVTADGLRWMREEEKLARDVYLALAERYDLPVFANIAASEQAHMDAVGALLERYGLDDPAAGAAVGAFTEPELQALYDTLTAKGATSLGAALEVGATIEELDIADLRARATAAPDVARLYAALERGSGNHLTAFTTLYQRVTGTAYRPTRLDPAEVDRIVRGG